MKFWEGFRATDAVSAVLAIGIWATIAYLAISGRDISNVLVAAGTGIVTFFFGRNQGITQERDRQILLKK